jgi:hypothetical protein
MGPGQNGGGVVIRRHDVTKFRQAVQPANAQVPAPLGNVPLINP